MGGIVRYLAEVEEHRQAKTYAAYRRSILSFAQHRLGLKDVTLETLSGLAVPVFIEELTREDALAWIAALRKSGNEPRTLFNRANNLNIFIRHFGVPALLAKKDKPKFTEKKVRAYNETELAKLFEDLSRSTVPAQCGPVSRSIAHHLRGGQQG